MFSNQGETGFGMIEGGVLPSGSIMASRTIRAELSIMAIIFSMARITVFGRAFIAPSGMAGGATDAHMLSGQRKTRFRMIESGVLPSGSIMTGRDNPCRVVHYGYRLLHGMSSNLWAYL